MTYPSLFIISSVNCVLELATCSAFGRASAGRCRCEDFAYVQSIHGISVAAPTLWSRPTCSNDTQEVSMHRT